MHQDIDASRSSSYASVYPESIIDMHHLSFPTEQQPSLGLIESVIDMHQNTDASRSSNYASVFFESFIDMHHLSLLEEQPPSLCLLRVRH